MDEDTDLSLNIFVLGAPAEKGCVIRISSTNSVQDLKRAMHDQAPFTRELDVVNSTIWKPKEPAPSTLEDIGKRGGDISQWADMVNAMVRLRLLFPSTPTVDYIHLVALIPSCLHLYHRPSRLKRSASHEIDDPEQRRQAIKTQPRTPPQSYTMPNGFDQTPIKSKEEFDLNVDKKLDELRPRMRELVQHAGDISHLIPDWVPGPHIDKEAAEYFSKLHIPGIPTDRPSLLLHRLGERPSANEKTSTTFQAVFHMHNNIMLINTSGTGKTRFLLDGLCSRWGFYFVGMKNAAGIGSNDLATFVDEFKEAKGHEDTDEARKLDIILDRMQNMAQHRFLQLLLSRFLILNLLIEEAKSFGGLREHHRRLWVLLQVQPLKFNPKSPEDLFLTTARELQCTSIEDLNKRIHEQYTRLWDDLDDLPGPQTSVRGKYPVYCILDEAQITSTQRIGEFRSNENELVERPVLREIWHAWTKVLHRNMRVILSGTGIDIEQIRSTLASPFLKPEPIPIYSCLGGFEDSESQAEYIKRYIPATWDQQTWKEFLIRAFAWFQGRYRSTATLIVLLLLGGYKCPHRTIGKIVEAYASFKPTEAVDWVKKEPDFPPINIAVEVPKLKLDKLSPMQAKTLSEMLHKQFFAGRYLIGPFDAEARTTFVEQGIARISTDLGHSYIDEPLIKAALDTWFKQRPHFSLFEWCRSRIDVHSSEINGYEAFTTHYLLTALENSPWLKDVFTLREDQAQQSDPTWSESTLQLVTLSKGVYDDNARISVVTHNSGPSANIGFRANSNEDVLEWMAENKQQVAFCYPPPLMGPDILFFVQFQQSKQLILVAIQAKKHEIVDRNVLMEGVRTVTPSWFWRRRRLEYKTVDMAPCSDEKAASRVQEILREIPNGQRFEGAEYPVLRVFASFPGRANIERTTELGRCGTSGTSTIIDDDKHPLASLNETTFAELNKAFDRLPFQGDQKTEELKRHFVEEEEEEEPASSRQERFVNS
ncbi:hypothetical protein CPB86DRAFT_49890 [Serendipita vermifera]|nr:hypothetical protein CPB86DRAFT_49890 [Serendipita vermifera]